VTTGNHTPMDSKRLATSTVSNVILLEPRMRRRSLERLERQTGKPTQYLLLAAPSPVRTRSRPSLAWKVYTVLVAFVILALG
jgi:hypothetical protein